MEFIQNHWTEIAGVLALVVVVGERVAALTETKKDDAVFGWVHKILAGVGLKFPDPK